MPLLTPWQRVRPGPRSNPPMAGSGRSTAPVLPAAGRRRLTVLALLALGGSIAGILLSLRRPSTVSMRFTWEVHGVHPLVLTDTAVLAREAGDSAAPSVVYIDVVTGSTAALNVDVVHAPVPVTGGAAWLQGESVFVRDPGGRTTAMPGVPSGSSLLYCWGTTAGANALIAYPAPDQAGSWKVRHLDSTGVRWELGVRGIPVTARADGGYLVVGVTDLSDGPQSSVYLLERDTGRVILEYQVGRGFLRALKLLPQGLLFAASGTRAVLLFRDGRLACQVFSEGTLLSADAAGEIVCVVEVGPAGQDLLRAISRDGSVRWYKRLKGASVVRCFAAEVICLERAGIRCFSSDSGEELWYYPIKDWNAWLLESGILFSEGDTLRFLRYGAGPG